MKNETYSHKDFTNQTLVGIDPSEFSNMEIVGSNFYQQGTDYVDVFPVGTTGVTFTNCNMDNVVIPAGCSIAGNTCNQKIARQNDLVDWVMNGTPREPVAKAAFIAKGLSIDPLDIPAEKLSKSILES